MPNPPPISADDEPLTVKIRSFISRLGEKKGNRSNLVRDSITAAAENVAAGLWALMGRGGNRISATEDRCPGNPDRPTGICRYNRGLNRHRSLSAPTPLPNVLSSITYRFPRTLQEKNKQKNIKYSTWSLKRSLSCEFRPPWGPPLIGNQPEEDLVAETPTGGCDGRPPL
jgi:hypothetical protein